MDEQRTQNPHPQTPKRGATEGGFSNPPLSEGGLLSIHVTRDECIDNGSGRALKMIIGRILR
jgi:hypothetical protein